VLLARALGGERRCSSRARIGGERRCSSRARMGENVGAARARALGRTSVQLARALGGERRCSLRAHTGENVGAACALTRGRTSMQLARAHGKKSFAALTRAWEATYSWCNSLSSSSRPLSLSHPSLIASFVRPAELSRQLRALHRTQQGRLRGLARAVFMFLPLCAFISRLPAVHVSFDVAATQQAMFSTS